MFRFIHSSDLHLGKRFANFDGDLPARLREARHGVIGRLAAAARAQGADTILLAGDVFDSETPAPDVWRQALNAMRAAAPINWAIIPGNHDSLQASLLWGQLQAEAPANVRLALLPEPLQLAPDVVLLPAPCTTRRPGRDLTAWMEAAATPPGTIRIGLAHGPIQSFSEDSGAGDVIAPDRARRAGLAYLALGDWHGRMAIDPRTHYSGTPEPDRFKHEGPGVALVVSLAGPDAPPEVVDTPLADFTWRSMVLECLGESDPVDLLGRQLPIVSARRNQLLNIRATGRLSLEARRQLVAGIERVAPDFALLTLDEAALATDIEVTDLDRIDRAGALREAADHLLSAAEDSARSLEQRQTARAALARLYAYALEAGR